MSESIFFKMRQPGRGLFAFAVSAVVGVLLWFIGVSWWNPFPNGVADLTNYLMWVFVWLWVMMMYFSNWPFNKLSYLWQSVCATLECLVVAGVLWSILHALEWDAYMSPIGVAIIFWEFMLNGWSNNPISTAYNSRQPITGISGTITCFGFGLVTWWLIPERFSAVMGGEVPVGFPFVWFVVSLIFVMTLQGWPFQVKQPYMGLLLLGYLSFFSFVILGILSAFGMHWWAAGDKTISWMMCLMLVMATWVTVFQFWPIHSLSNPLRGFIVLIPSVAIATLIYWALIAWAPDWVSSFKVIGFGFALATGEFFYFGLWGGAQAPPISSPPVEPQDNK